MSMMEALELKLEIPIYTALLPRFKKIFTTQSQTTEAMEQLEE